ncbi:type II toxin-antitoxin system ParD family antitoxin [Ancrocorticia populi]
MSRSLEGRETQMEALREALVAGEASGVAEPFDFDTFIAMKKS